MEDMITCACGCGGELPRLDKRGRPRLFLPSHWSKVQPSKRTSETCEYCGAPVERAQWHKKRIKHVFCNLDCMGKWATNEGIRKGENNGHYNTITVPCAGCGADVSKASSLINRRSNRVYCQTCIPLYVKRFQYDTYAQYPREFSPALRHKIRVRDGRQCQECGKPQDEVGILQIHHIDYDKTNNHPVNLVALCPVCHGRTNFSRDTWQAHFVAFMAARFPQEIRAE